MIKRKYTEKANNLLYETGRGEYCEAVFIIRFCGQSLVLSLMVSHISYLIDECS